jgi:general secretion pathway protein F
MPIFHYKGYRSDGSSASGSIEADGLQNAIAAVRARGIYPRDIDEYRHRERKWSRRSTDDAILPHITRQLSILLSSGVPLIDALRSLSEEKTGFWRGVMVGIRESVAGGASLSRAMGSEKQVFPEFYVNMVAAGEQSGALDQVLIRVADFLEQQAAVRAKIRMSMVYPLFMASVGFIVMSFLFTFVVPKIVKIFENTGSALPLITVILIGISNLFVRYWWALSLLAAAAAFSWKRVAEKNRRRIDGMKLRLPGGVMQSLYYGRFARTLGFLLGGGLPMLRSLELAAKSAGNVIVQERVTAAAKRVAEGARLSLSLEGFPSVLLQLIATGEKSGTLPEVLEKGADSYEEDFERKVQKALSLLEPSMILAMGLVVGFIVLAVLLPIFQLNQIVK